jgi:hypothetical protein
MVIVTMIVQLVNKKEFFGENWEGQNQGSRRITVLSG